MSRVILGVLLAGLAVELAACLGLWLHTRAGQPAPVQAYTYRYARTGEPWEASHPHALRVTLDAVRSIADPVELGTKSCDHERIDGIETSVYATGLREPLEVNVDPHGRCCLANGYHRLCALSRLNRPTAPVVFRSVDRIPGYGRPVSGLLVLIAPA